MKNKKENLDEYADVVFQEIIKSLNTNPMTMNPAQLKDQAAGSDENIASAISNIEISDQRGSVDKTIEINGKESNLTKLIKTFSF